MSGLLWSFDQLVRYTKYEDQEVRYWAAERLTALFPEEAADAIAELLFDDHDTTPELVAEHLGKYGGPRHVPILMKGFRTGTDITPGRCIEALARLGFEGTPTAAATALHRREMSEACLGIMVSALAEMATAKHSADAADRAREFLLRRPELFAEPAALRGAVSLFAPADLSDLMLKWITALHFKGIDRMEPCITVLIEELQLEDCGWCVRTDRSGRIDLERTLKAIESGYDVEVRGAIPAQVREEISSRLKRGAFSEIASSLGGFLRTRVGRIEAQHDDALPRRLDALGRAFETPALVEMAEQLEPAMHQWLIGLLVAAAVKVSIYRNYLLDLQTAGSDLDQLLSLAEVETSCLLRTLPGSLAAASEGDPQRKDRLIEWCVRTLEARGPFFPKAIALETLGTLKAAGLVPEIAAHLADDNPYIYGFAERALARIGPPVIRHARAVLAAGGSTHPDVLHSLMRLACEQGREESLKLLLDYFDETFETLGPDPASELASLVAHQDLVPHLRRWLDRSTAMAGHTLLLIGALHNLPIPEEEKILKAIDDYWKVTSEGPDGGGPSGQYLM